jgi:hypothetical protein
MEIGIRIMGFLKVVAAICRLQQLKMVVRRVVVSFRTVQKSKKTVIPNYIEITVFLFYFILKTFIFFYNFYSSKVKNPLPAQTALLHGSQDV